MKKVVGHVTEHEKREIMQLNNHMNSLEELLQCISCDDELYDKVHRDIVGTKAKYQEWWNNMYQKYKWEKGKGDWTIIFEKNEIITTY